MAIEVNDIHRPDCSELTFGHSDDRSYSGKSYGTHRPTDVSLDEVTTAMLSDLDELARQVNDIRPLSPEVLRQVKEELFGERVFSSNAIEGKSLHPRNTPYSPDEDLS